MGIRQKGGLVAPHRDEVDLRQSTWTVGHDLALEHQEGDSARHSYDSQGSWGTGVIHELTAKLLLEVLAHDRHEHFKCHNSLQSYDPAHRRIPVGI